MNDGFFSERNPPLIAVSPVELSGGVIASRLHDDVTLLAKRQLHLQQEELVSSVVF